MFIELTEVSEDGENNLLLALSDIRAVRAAPYRANSKSKAKSIIALFSSKSIDVAESVETIKECLSKAKMILKTEKEVRY